MTEEGRIRRPSTLDAAADLLIAFLSDSDRAAFAAMKEEDLIGLHISLGLFIRQEFGLWEGNSELMKSCGSHHPDDASVAIIQAAWEKLRRYSQAMHSDSSNVNRDDDIRRDAEILREVFYRNNALGYRKEIADQQENMVEEVIAPLIKKHLKEIYPAGVKEPGLYGVIQIWTSRGKIMQVEIPFVDENDFNKFRKPFTEEVESACANYPWEWWMRTSREDIKEAD